MDEAIYTALAERLAAGAPGVLATVVATRGSTPQGPGAKAIFTPEGGVIGTIGGGCLEHEARLRALDCLRDGRPALIEVDLTGEYDQDTGLICGGRAEILLTLPAAGDLNLFRRLADCRATGLAGALATVAEGEGLGGCGVATDENERLGDGVLAGLAWEALRTRTLGLVEESGRRVWLDPVLPRQRLWIAGAGHVGRAIARHAAAVEFEVTVVDDRPDLCGAENIPWAERHLVGDIEAELAGREYGPEDYVVVVTRGHRHDADALRAVVRSGARYLGLIGSRRKIKLIGEGLVDEGSATEAELARVFAPIGLDIGAVTVDEIAICVVAELIAVRRGVLESPADRAQPLRRKPGRRPSGCAG